MATPERKTKVSLVDANGQAVDVQVSFRSPTIEVFQKADETAQKSGDWYVVRRLAAILTAISIEDDAGKQLTPKLKSLKQLPIETLRRIYKAVMAVVETTKDDLKDQRRWYAQKGAGKAIAEHDIYVLAIEFKCSPAEIRSWDLYDVERVSLILKARIEAREDAIETAEKQYKKKR